jgi:NADH-quinone oxidoreductase subunit J
VISFHPDTMIHILCLVTAFLAAAMLFARSTITTAFCFLGVLLGVAGLYALMNELFLAAIQLLVYAGAIMVLFVFAIMLLNLSGEKRDLNFKRPTFYLAVTSAAGCLVLVISALCRFFSSAPAAPEAALELENKTVLIARTFFATHYIIFELLSIALLLGLVAAVLLAKRKFD